MNIRRFALMNQETGGEGGATGGGETSGDSSDYSIDMDKVSNDLGEELFGADHSNDEDDADDTDNDGESLEEGKQTVSKTPEDKAAKEKGDDGPKFTPRPAPQSWSKEKHEVWSKLDPQAQEYIEQREKQMHDGVQLVKEDAGFGKSMKDVIAPYNGLIQAQGLDAPKAVQYLLNAHHVLSNSSPDQKLQHLAKIAESYGINLGQVQQNNPQSKNVDSLVRQLQNELSEVKGYLSQGQQQAAQARAAQVASEVETFASSEKAPYFDECADQIVAFINAGDSLESAYEKAVWANPVTRAKEIERATKLERENFEKRAKEEARNAKKVTASNLNGRDTRKTPTASKGTMDDTLRETFTSIKNRSH